MPVIDIVIVIASVVIITLIGLYFKEKDFVGIDSYFLENRKISW